MPHKMDELLHAAGLFDFLKIRHLSTKRRGFFLFASLLPKSSLRLSSFFPDFPASLYKFSATCCMQYRCTASPRCTHHPKCGRSKTPFIPL
jgi:hypothetical protein